MKNNLEQKLSQLKQSGRKALIPFVTSGFPDQTRFGQLAAALLETEPDVLEIGLPHSDPLADGPVIQHSSHVAIANGFKLERAFDQITEMTTTHSVPIVIMCYSNLILRMGAKKFVKRASAAGVSGLIVPDMIIEESAELRSLCAEREIAFINLIAPTTTRERIQKIVPLSSGFVYLVSVTGTTGMRDHFDAHIDRTIRVIRKTSHLPICIGFGISSPELAARAAAQADGVIIGSKLLQLATECNGDSRFEKVRSFLTEVKMRLGELS